MRVVIFCGGYGTRMWPVSRKSFPKQFYPLIEGKSFFELTYRRFTKVFKPKDIFVSTEKIYTQFVRKIAPDIPKENIIAEPERRDNLGAIGLVCAILEKRFPSEVMVVSWSDHLIGKEGEFLKAIMAAGEYATQTGLIVSVDEEPGYPSVHHGWVKLGETIDAFKGYSIVRITKHIEKPKENIAKRMFAGGGYLLNTGYRAWKTDLMLSFYKEYQPAVFEGLTKIMEADGKSYADTIIYREYHKFPKDSIESGIFEKLPEDKRVAIPVDVGWRDVGTWELFYKSFKKDENENLVAGGAAEFIDSNGNLIIGVKEKIVGAIGISNLVIVDTPDGLLVATLDKTDKVKELFKTLEEKKPKFVE
ncbi:mannose-1-phosphate guanylyltransferase [Candidatus Woesebacteria bacterium]|nr:mannose-1-phosphate guanylyltransferase [Candidatus Woesebacteria bacterium]